MSAAHFIGVKPSNMPQTHSLLKKTHVLIEIHDLFPFIAFGEGIYRNSPKLQNALSYKELCDIGLLERIFLSVNPKFASKSLRPNELVYLTKYCLVNQIERVHKQTKVYHNISVKDVFLNIGGINCLLPFLHQLIGVEHELRDEILEKVIEIIIECALNDIQRTELFMDNGIMMLNYLLEKMAAKKPLPENVLNSLKRLMDVIKDFYPCFLEQYLERVFYNPEIWRHSADPIQDKILEHMRNVFIYEKHDPAKVAHHIDILLNFIEVYTNQEQLQESRLMKLKGMVLTMAQENVTREVLLTLFGYANAFFIRRLKNHPVQIFYILSIFLDLYVSCMHFAVYGLIGREKVTRVLKDVLKQKKDSKIICTIFTVFDYFMYIKELLAKGMDNGGNNRTEYKGILYAHKASYREESEFLKEGTFWEIVEAMATLRRDRGKSEISDELLMSRVSTTKENVDKIDAVISICGYLILTLDCADLFKEVLKEFMKDEMTKKHGDIVGTLFRYLGRQNAKTQIIPEQPLLGYIFNGSDKRVEGVFAPVSYAALVSKGLGIPFAPDKWKERKDVEFSKIIKPGSGVNRIIKRKAVVEHIMQNFETFNESARLEILNDLRDLSADERLAREFAEDVEGLTCSLFGLMRFPESQPFLGKLLSETLAILLSIPSLSNTLIRVSTNMKGKPLYKLQVINDALNKYLIDPVKLDPKSFCGLLHISYVIEDCVLEEPTLLACELTIELLSKLLVTLDKSNLLYISLPVMTHFDERTVPFPTVPTPKERSYFCIQKL